MNAPKTRQKPKLIDPISVLNSIAADVNAPATARVAAAKALLQASKALSAADEPTDDPLERRALEILLGQPN